MWLKRRPGTDVDGRRIDLGQGTVGYRGPTFERRLAVIVDMADRLSSPVFSSLIGPSFARLQEEWQRERPDINDAADALRVLDGTRSVDPQDLRRMKTAIEQALLEEARSGCRSDELRELISVVDTSAGPAVSAARSAFSHYRRSLFAGELRDCRSVERFDGLHRGP